MQTPSTRVRTNVAKSISYDGIHDDTNTEFMKGDCTWMNIKDMRNQNKL